MLASCYTEALRIAEELGASTVAFPAISTGAYGYPLELAASIAIAAVRAAGERIDVVRFVLLEERAFRAFEDALGKGRT